jgi:D-3-phosphoglycerate dehydrogenase / 2-oxoglutarate reductase
VSAKVLVTDYAWPSLDIERDVLGSIGAQLVVAASPDEATLVDLAQDADAILTNWATVPPAALDVAARCVVVSRYGVGVDNIPVARATELGIAVSNVPDFCRDEVSDHTLALLLASARRVVHMSRETVRGVWSLEQGPQLRRVRGLTLGLVGYGSIARAVVPKAQAFGLRVVAYSPRLAPRVMEDGVEAVESLDALLVQSDFVSLHAPLRPETAGMIGDEQLRLMKPSSYLINTSRGGLVDEDALYRALDEGWIAGAAVDVLVDEPPQPDLELLRLDGLVVTPHAAFYSDAAIAELQRRAAENVATALQGRLPPTLVNPAVARSPRLRITG